jgi:hypothetical protein
MQPFFAKASRRKAQREAIHAQHEHSYRKNLFMSICSDTCCSTGELYTIATPFLSDDIALWLIQIQQACAQ